MDYFSETFSNHHFLNGNWFTYLFIKRFNFLHYLQIPFSLFIIQYNCCSVMEKLIIIIDRIYCCFLVFYPITKMYIYNASAFIMQQQSKLKSLPLIGVSSRISYLLRSDLIFFNTFICFIINRNRMLSLF